MKRVILLRIAIMFAGMSLANGCAAPIETRLTSGGPGLGAGAPLALLAPEEDVPAVDPALRKLIEASFASRGYVIKDDAALVLDAAISDRPNTIGFKASDARQSAQQKKRFLGNCGLRIHRLTLSISDRKSGALLYQGQAEEAHCKAKLSDSLPHLVNAVANDLAKPVGQLLLKRSGAR